MSNKIAPRSVAQTKGASKSALQRQQHSDNTSSRRLLSTPTIQATTARIPFGPRQGTALVDLDDRALAIAYRTFTDEDAVLCWPLLAPEVFAEARRRGLSVTEE